MQVLILDDKKVDLETMVDAAEALGLDVRSTQDPGTFREAAGAGEHDLQIVDHKLDLPVDVPGAGDGPGIVALSAAMASNVPTVMLTNFTPDCEAHLAKYDPRLITTVVPKPALRTVAEWRAQLEPAIEEVTSRPAPDRGELLGVSLAENPTPFFDLQPNALKALDEDSRDDLESAAGLGLHSAMQPIWAACDDDWLLLQRSEDTVLVVDRGHDNRLVSDEAMAASEADRGSVALLIGRPTMLEETASLIDCAPGMHNDWRRYPYVRLIVGSDEREFHLDTGSNTSFMSLDYLKARLGLRPRRTKVSIVEVPDGRAASQFEIPVDVDMHVSGASGGNIQVSLQVRAVRKWSRGSMLNPPCAGQLCPDSEHGQCGRRLGLMGRDLLYAFEHGLWQFDPSTGRFHAESPPH